MRALTMQSRDCGLEVSQPLLLCWGTTWPWSASYLHMQGDSLLLAACVYEETTLQALLDNV